MSNGVFGSQLRGPPLLPLNVGDISVTSHVTFETPWFRNTSMMCVSAAR